MTDYSENIRNSGLTIYHQIPQFDENLWIPNTELEIMLTNGLRGISTSGMPNRTRSKYIKELICQVLGYPIPRSFMKTQPRFVGQNFDVYVQKSNNLQIWNEEIDVERRYVLVRVSPLDVITRAKVVTGNEIAHLDTTGTLTQKYQARLTLGQFESELVSKSDTDNLSDIFEFQQIIANYVVNDVNQAYKSSNVVPSAYHLLPIEQLFELLNPLIGQTFNDAGSDQERNRGAELHRLVCNQLGYSLCPDDGQFPDIRHQLLEIKLQTSPTIDLGLVRPDDQRTISDMPLISNMVEPRYCDVRYAVFYATTDGKTVKITNLFLTTGEQFFSRFSQFQVER